MAHSHAALAASVVDALDDVVFATDPEGRLAYLNPAWATLTGHLVEDSLGTPLTDHVDGIGAAGGEARCLTAYGGVRWVDVRLSGLPGGGQCGVIADVTDRRREASRLVEAEARYRGAFDHAATGMAVVAPDGRPLRVNAAFGGLAGRSADDLMELTVSDITHPDDLPTDLALWDRLTEGETREYEVDKRLVRPDGGVVWVRQSIALVRDDEGRPMYAVAHFQDISAARRAAERGARGALVDEHTGLPNDELFHDRLGLALERTRRSGRRVGVLRCTVTGVALEDAAARLGPVLRPGDTVARVGEHDLAVLLEALHDDAEADVVARRVMTALAGLPVKIGIATAGEGEGAPRQIVAKAASASRGVEESRLQRDLRKALELDELRLAFQPVVTLEGGRLTGLEALLRWDDPRGGLRVPGDFLGAAGAAGLLPAFGEWVLREACRAMAGWRAAGLADDLTLGVNLSAAELRREELPGIVADALRDAGLPPEVLRLEVTEESAGAAAVPALRALTRIGVAIALDDFGAGAGAFPTVTRIPGLAEVKVDGGLVRGAGANRESAAVLAAVISLCRSLGVAAVAEGLESATEVRLLRDLGCTHGQGFWFSRPLPGAEVEPLLRRAELGELGI